MDREVIQTVMSAIKDNIGTFTVIEGEARGADAMSRSVAELVLHLPVKKFPANWDLHGKAAGPIRNMKMLQNGKADAVVAFHHNLHLSKGTRHMVEIALKAGKPVYVSEEGPLKLAEFVLQLKKLQKENQ